MKKNFMARSKRDDYIRDMNNNLMDSPDKLLATNNEDIQAKAAPKPLSELRGIGRRSSIGLYEEYVDEKGKIYNILLSKATGEYLPAHLHLPNLFVFTEGTAGSGKTTSLLSWDIHSYIFEQIAGLHFALDDIVYVPGSLPQAYQTAKDRFLRGIRPDRTKTNAEERVQRLNFFATGLVGRVRRALGLALFDVAGEMHFHANHKFMRYADMFLIFLSAADLKDVGAMTENLNNVRSYLQQFPNAGRVPAYVILTQVDENTEVFSELKKTIGNTLSLKNGRFREEVHQEGYDLKVDAERSALVRSIIHSYDPRYTGAVEDGGARCVTYFAISALGGKVENDRIPKANENCFRFEEPLLRLFFDFGLFPEKKTPEPLPEPPEEDPETDMAGEGDDPYDLPSDAIELAVQTPRELGGWLSGGEGIRGFFRRIGTILRIHLGFMDY